MNPAELPIRELRKEPSSSGSQASSVLGAETYDLVETLSEAGVELTEKEGSLAFKAPEGRLTESLKQRIRAQKSALLALLGPDEAARANARVLPLSELQQSYWLGEASARGVPGAGHWYNRFSVPTLDLVRLQAALDALMTRHDFLRSVVTPEGRLRILERIPAFPLQVHDLTELTADEATRQIAEMSESMSRASAACDEWPLYRMCIQRTREGFTAHVSGRLLSADAPSWYLYVQELGALLEHPERTDLGDPKRLSVAVLRRFRRLVSAAYQRDRQYWSSRALPPSPELPTRTAGGARVRFRRLVGDLSQGEAIELASRAKEGGVTIDNALLAAYAVVLARWAQRSEFCINVLHGGARHLGPPLGHFGGVLRLELGVHRHLSFVDSARAVRQQLAQDMSHASMDGVAVQRLSMQGTGSPRQAHVVAYSSGLSVTDGENEVGLSQLGWKAELASLQTPGVLIDQQVFRTSDGLRFQWDVDSDELCPGVAEEMFAAYADLVRRIAGAHDWSTPIRVELSESQIASQVAANATDHERSLFVLHELLERQTRDRSGPAIVSPERTLSFADLRHYAGSVSRALRALPEGLRAPVGIVANRGWQQVAAALGILRAGAAYVPLDPGWPSVRLASVLTAAGCRAVFCDKAGVEALSALPEVSAGSVRVERIAGALEAAGEDDLEPSAGQLAYVMFTSGSTGEPKGVAISHDAAANTIEDILRRFEIGPNDSVLGVSSFHFDLSVFDCFGVLGAGGRLVLPPHKSRPDPMDLVPLIQEHRVTLWNSVPAIMEMVVEYAEASRVQLPSLRLVMLSGDWIPVTLPARIRKVCPNARIISLGGATEASIWSNVFEIADVPTSWSSIPYGFPLANQALHVLSSEGDLCPDWVEGDLAIAGMGLADGYWNSVEQTRSVFVDAHPATGERLYFTGDRARRWPDGNLEFLGRKDGQVKVGGHRIELGEVSAALLKCASTDKAAVVAVGPREHRWLAAFVTGEAADEAEIHAELSALLPSYMVPRRVHRLEGLPCTPNGKLDEARLRELALLAQPTVHPPSTPDERTMAELWGQVLGRDVNDAGLSFFEVGGESVLAVRLVNAIEHRTGQRPLLADVLRVPTIAGMAGVLAGRVGSSQGALVPMRRGAPRQPTIVCIHPVGGTVYCYRQLLELLDQRLCVVGLQSMEAVAGDGSLAALASSYTEQLHDAGITPALLFGWSMGGVLALEIQQRLQRVHGLHVPAVLVDPWVRHERTEAPPLRELEVAFIRDVLRGAAALSREQLTEQLRERPLVEVVRALGIQPVGARDSDISSLFEQFQLNTLALVGYDPPRGLVDADVWVADAQRPADFPYLQPLAHCRQVPRLHGLPADHYTIMEGGALQQIATCLTRHVEARREVAS